MTFKVEDVELTLIRPGSTHQGEPRHGKTSSLLEVRADFARLGPEYSDSF